MHTVTLDLAALDAPTVIFDSAALDALKEDSTALGAHASTLDSAALNALTGIFDSTALGDYAVILGSAALDALELILDLPAQHVPTVIFDSTEPLSSTRKRPNLLSVSLRSLTRRSALHLLMPEAARPRSHSFRRRQLRTRSPSTRRR